MASKPSIVLFRRDLRLADNPALRAGAERGAVIPLFILDDCERQKLGGAALWWLHFSLSELAGALADRGALLVLRRGDSGAVIRSLVAETGADAVFWNRRYTSAGMAADKALKTALTEAGVAARSFNASLLREFRAIDFVNRLIERGIIATRQLAKRQFTWLRSETDLHRMHNPTLNDIRPLLASQE